MILGIERLNCFPIILLKSNTKICHKIIYNQRTGNTLAMGSILVEANISVT